MVVMPLEPGRFMTANPDTSTRNPPEMHLLARFDQRLARFAIVLSLVVLVALASVAMAYAGAPKAVGGSGGDVVLPVEPDGGIGGEVVLPVEPDGGIGN